MSLKPEPIGSIPPETASVAKAACPRGSTFKKMHDVLGVLVEDEMFAGLFPHDGQPALALWRLALIFIIQFVEGLVDRQAADAVRTRIDWKYALGLELECAKSMAAASFALMTSTIVSGLSRTISNRRQGRATKTRRSISHVSRISCVGMPRNCARSIRKSARPGTCSSDVVQTPYGQANAKHSTTSRTSTVLPCPTQHE